MLDRQKQAGQSSALSQKRVISRETRIMLSVFSWDVERKGADVLLKAFRDEFRLDDNVILLILSNRAVSTVEQEIFRITNPTPKKKKKKRKKVSLSGFGSKKKTGKKKAKMVSKEEPKLKPGIPAPIMVLRPGVHNTMLRSLYKLASGFVLPSRGEGNSNKSNSNLPVI
jgi:hypothetical protein